MSSETFFIVDINQHAKKNLPTVVKFLRSRGIKGARIFTEASDSDLKRTHPFYGKLSEFILKQKAIEIHEPEYESSMKRARELYEETLSPELKALRHSSFGWQPWTRVAEFDRYTQIVCQVRDPIIAKQIIEQVPKYSIFGAGHIPGVLTILRDQSSLKIDVLKLFSSPTASTRKN